MFSLPSRIKASAKRLEVKKKKKKVGEATKASRLAPASFALPEFDWKRGTQCENGDSLSDMAGIYKLRRGELKVSARVR